MRHFSYLLIESRFDLGDLDTCDRFISLSDNGVVAVFESLAVNSDRRGALSLSFVGLRPIRTGAALEFESVDLDGVLGAFLVRLGFGDDDRRRDKFEGDRYRAEHNTVVSGELDGLTVSDPLVVDERSIGRAGVSNREILARVDRKRSARATVRNLSRKMRNSGYSLNDL